MGDLRRLVAKKAGIDIAHLQLFRHGKEVKPEKFDDKTLLELEIHTGFSLKGYDLSVPPDYWPPVRQTPEGLEVIPAMEEQSTATLLGGGKKKGPKTPVVVS